VGVVNSLEGPRLVDFFKYQRDNNGRNSVLCNW